MIGKSIAFFLLSSLLCAASALQGEIISCSSWKLNRLPEVRRFLKEVRTITTTINTKICRFIPISFSNILQPGHADAYENVKVTFIQGRSPTLFLRDDGNVLVETIDLSPVLITHTNSYYHSFNRLKLWLLYHIRIP